MKNAVVLVPEGIDCAVVLAPAREQGYALHALSECAGAHTSMLSIALDWADVLGMAAIPGQSGTTRAPFDPGSASVTAYH